uniref:CS domain-containing protein n=1 Tax=Scleropages formosus TaxID=113540 RepID=A0A8C9VM88_SCLFO
PLFIENFIGIRVAVSVPLTAAVKLPSGKEAFLKIHLLRRMAPEQSTLKILSNKTEIKMKETKVICWEKLRREGVQTKEEKPDLVIYINVFLDQHYIKPMWDKLVGDNKDEEKNERLEEAAVSDEAKHGMNKAFGVWLMHTSDWQDIRNT